MIGYIRTSKPLSLQVAPLPVIGSDDKYLLPVVAQLGQVRDASAGVSLSIETGPYTGPMPTMDGGLAGTISDSQWTVAARPPVVPGAPLTLASDEPGAHFRYHRTEVIKAGASGSRMTLGLQGLLPRPVRPVADIEQTQTKQEQAGRMYQLSSQTKAAASATSEAVLQTIVVSACEGCTPFEGSRGVQGKGKGLSDEWRGSILVEPAGYLREAHASGMVSSGSASDIRVALPRSDEVIPGSLRAAFALYPSPAATLGAALESLLQQPHGCFEQSSATVYPLAMALRYFRMHPDTPKRIVEKAESLLADGYKKLVKFECSEHPGGFEWFGCSGSGTPAHEALTAYGALEFLDMASVWDGVDADLLQRVRKFLMQSRDGKGGFRREQQAIDSFGRAPQHTTDAYILWAMLSPQANERASGTPPKPEQVLLAAQLENELIRATSRIP